MRLHAVQAVCGLVSDLDENNNLSKLVGPNKCWDKLHKLCKETEATYFIESQLITNSGS